MTPAPALDRAISEEARLAVEFLAGLSDPRAPWADRFTAWAAERGLSEAQARSVRRRSWVSSRDRRTTLSGITVLRLACFQCSRAQLAQYGSSTAMTYFQLDRGILGSSLWAQGTPEQTKVWIYLLLAADPRTGVVREATPAIALHCGLPLDTVEAALDWLTSPDPHSRTKAHEGRRIQRLEDGQLLVLNYAAYATKDHSTPRVRRYRERKKAAGQGVAESATATSTSDVKRVSPFPNRYRNEGQGQGQGQEQIEEVSREGGSIPPPVPPALVHVQHDDVDVNGQRRKEGNGQGVTEETASAIIEAANAIVSLQPELKLEQVIEEGSRIEAGHGRAEKSFRDPRRRGISQGWAETTLVKLEELRKRILSRALLDQTWSEPPQLTAKEAKRREVLAVSISAGLKQGGLGEGR